MLNIFFVYFKNDKFTYPNSFFCVALAPIYIGKLTKKKKIKWRCEFKTNYFNSIKMLCRNSF